MIFNYIKIAWRNLTKQKLYSAINISGLAVGLAVCMMIMMYVTHEMSYDGFHQNVKNIFMLTEQMNMQGQQINIERMSYATGTIISQRVPGVNGCTRIYKPFKPVLIESSKLKDAKFAESKMIFGDPNFFSFFTFKSLSGNLKTALSNPFSLVISRNMAVKYFGTQNPVGKTLKIKIEKAYTYTVTGIAENIPSNSSIVFDFLASAASLTQMPEAEPFFAITIFTRRGIHNLFIFNAPPGFDPRSAVNSIANKKKRACGQRYPTIDRFI
jgi:putative ABC transport system permease protein